MFTQQLVSMLDASLPLAPFLDVLQEKMDDQGFRNIIRDVKNDIASDTSFSEAFKKFPKVLES